MSYTDHPTQATPGTHVPAAPVQTAAQQHTRRAGVRSTETKSAFKTTEFVAYVLTFAGILIAAAVVGGGDDNQDDFLARHAWLYLTILSSAYFIGRGLAKAGSREPYSSRDEGNELIR